MAGAAQWSTDWLQNNKQESHTWVHTRIDTHTDTHIDRQNTHTYAHTHTHTPQLISRHSWNSDWKLKLKSTDRHLNKIPDSRFISDLCVGLHLFREHWLMDMHRVFSGSLHWHYNIGSTNDAAPDTDRRNADKAVVFNGIQTPFVESRGAERQETVGTVS